MSDQLGKVERHVHAGVRLAEKLAVDIAQQRPVHLVCAPAPAELVGRDRYRRKGGGRLGLKKAEPLLQLARDKPAQRHVIDEHEQFHVIPSLRGGRTHLDVVDDGGDLSLEIEPPLRASHHDVVGGSQHVIRSALVDQRITPEALRHLGAPGATDELHVIDVGAAVRPLVRPWQRCCAAPRVERKRRFQATNVEPLVDGRQLLGNLRPGIHSGLKSRSDLAHVNRPAQVPRNDDECAVTTRPQRCELHDGFSTAPRRIWSRSMDSNNA